MSNDQIPNLRKVEFSNVQNSRCDNEVEEIVEVLSQRLRDINWCNCKMGQNRRRTLAMETGVKQYGPALFNDRRPRKRKLTKRKLEF